MNVQLAHLGVNKTAPTLLAVIIVAVWMVIPLMQIITLAMVSLCHLQLVHVLSMSFNPSPRL